MILAPTLYPEFMGRFQIRNPPALGQVSPGARNFHTLRKHIPRNGKCKQMINIFGIQ
jgi:hypothetical protein